MSNVEYTVLPLEQKRLFCIELLNEFGISQYRERGTELTHRCSLPFGGHSDHNSWTASINYEKLAFNCLVCGYGGPISWWIAVNRGLDTDQVEPWLKDKLGLNHSQPMSDLLKVIDSIIHPVTEDTTMPYYSDNILDRWRGWAIYHPYLTDVRRIPEETLNRFEVGYADEDSDFHYTQRIIIPARWKGKIVGWQARALSKKDDPHYDIKYMNSPNFPRNRILYGDVDHRGEVIVVESPMSVLRHHHQTPMVATLGSKLTGEQIRLLERYRRLILFPDPDKAGYQWARKILNSGLPRSTRIEVAQSDYAEMDPADFTDHEYESILDGAVPGALWTPKRYRELRNYKTGELMSFRKFGTPEDSKVELDRPEDEKIRKSALPDWTRKDAQELEEENRSK